MGKNKNRANAGAQNRNVKSPEKAKTDDKPSTTQPPAPVAETLDKEVQSLTNDLQAKLTVSHPGEEPSRDDVMAARKAKAAAKAEKAAKAVAKKEAEAAQKGEKSQEPAHPQSTPASTAQNNQPEMSNADAMDEQSREDIIAARKAKAVAQRAEKAAKVAGGSEAQSQKQQAEKKNQAKSVLKQSGSGGEAQLKGVRFGMAQSQSEENLLIAMKHAEEANLKIELTHGDIRDVLHPALIPLLDRCENKEINCVDELCLLFLECAHNFIKQFVEDYRRQWAEDDSAESRLGGMMDDVLRAQLGHLSQGDRYPLPYALGNIVRLLKKEMMTLNVADESGRTNTVPDLLDWVSDFEKTTLHLASTAISGHLQGKIAAARKIVTYDWCPVVNQVLLDAVTHGSLRQLCVLDAVKNGPGIHHLFSLSHHRGYVEYGDLTAAGTVFEQGSLLLLGCSAVLSSGRISLSSGALQLALIAKSHNVPVLVLAPTYKFVDKAQTSSRLALLGRAPLELLPPDLVTAIVTEIRLLPPSSAPAVLKAKALDDAN